MNEAPRDFYKFLSAASSFPIMLTFKNTTMIDFKYCINKLMGNEPFVWQRELFARLTQGESENSLSKDGCSNHRA